MNTHKNKHRLIGIDNSMVVTRGKRGGVLVKVKGTKYMVTEDSTLGGGDTINIQMMYHRIVRLKPT